MNAQRIEKIKQDWATNIRWTGIKRPYTAEEVLALRGSYDIEYTIAKMGAEKLWHKLHHEPYVAGLGALTGNQAIQEAMAGLNAIYLSGWQVAADANLNEDMFPDQSIYPANSVPSVVRRINNALLRRDQIESTRGKVKQMIEAGASGVHFEDQLSSAKKCGHLGGKVLVPTQEAIDKLIAARLASDVCGVPTVLIARTDAEAADLLTSDADSRDQEFVTGERTSEGFFRVKNGLEQCISRAHSYAPYADLIWMETSNPDIGLAKEFAEAVHEKYPGKLLAYNCSPSFNWAKYLNEERMLMFRDNLAKLGYKFQFITLAGFHALNLSMFELAKNYKERGMLGYSELQQREFKMQESGFEAIKHQGFVGTGYWDYLQNVVRKDSSTTALAESTETAQF